MVAKVEEMLNIVGKNDDLHVHIFSGDISGNLFDGLSGKHLGTIISAT